MKELIDRWNTNPKQVIEASIFLVGMAAFVWLSFFIASKFGSIK